MLTATRHESIYQLLRTHGSVRVTDLTARLRVSEMTVRRDLNEMAESGLLKRVHGGAVLKSWGEEIERGFVHRKVAQLPAKLAIARLAKQIIEPRETLYFDGSTTCLELAKLLAGGLSLSIVTDSLAVFLELRDRKATDVTLLGGSVQQDGNTLAGPIAIDNVQRLFPGICFLSAFGFTVDGVTNPGMVGTTVERIMIQNAGRRVLLADGTKCGRTGLIEVCTWRDLDVLVTNAISPTMRESIEKQGVKVMVAEAVSEEDGE